jgi:hypothetical protein
MSEAVMKNSRSVVASAVVPRLFVLEVNAGRIHSMNPDGSDRKTIVSDFRLPDGIVVDANAGHIYWTNMGSSPGVNDGSIERADIDRKNRKVIVPPGITFTPKQIILEKKAASSIGATARACASCAAISMARSWRRSSRRGVAKPIAEIRRDGASDHGSS